MRRTPLPAARLRTSRAGTTRMRSPRPLPGVTLSTCRSTPRSCRSGLPVMLDTNFYIQRQRRKLPTDVAAFVENRSVLHSGVACAELAISAGILDPTHPGTAQNRAAIMEVLEAVNDT